MYGVIPNLKEVFRMKRSEAQYEVVTTKNILIPTRDGVELAADVLLPDAAGPFPVVLSY